MNSQQLLFINFLVILALVLLFVFGSSKRKQGIKLKLKTQQEPPSENLSEPTTQPTSEPANEQVAELVIKPLFVLKPDSSELSPQLSLGVPPIVEESKQVLPPEPQPVVREVGVPPAKLNAVKKIRIHFAYNGHEWDAHEVLGLEHGVSLEIATQHYQNLIKTSDISTFEFYEAAYMTILKQRKQ